jgi:NADH:ubiquinone reductase (H+-translocating)
MPKGSHRVVIIGGGFGGLSAARGLGSKDVQVTLVDRRNFHLFQPLLYQVATGGLSPANIAAPLRYVLRRHKNVQVLLGNVIGLDLDAREVQLDGGRLPYDTLVVAAGSTHHYFGHDEWAASAPGLKTIEDATEIRRKILLAFEMAERETDPSEIRKWLTFVVVGGGPTAVELAGAVAEIARHTLAKDFRSINPADAHVLLVEATDRVLPVYPAELSARGAKQLEQLGVAVRTGTMVVNVSDQAVTVRVGETLEDIPTRTVLWGAGVKASPLAGFLAAAAGLTPDRQGRVAVQADLSLAGHPDVFAIGDLALCVDDRGQPLPGVAPVAIQQGGHVAQAVVGRLRGKPTKPFRYRDYGSMATIGRHRAVAMVGKLRFAGTLAWLLWLFIHLMYIVEFQSRVLVLVQWAWNYLTWNRNARLITGTTER